MVPQSVPTLSPIILPTSDASPKTSVLVSFNRRCKPEKEEIKNILRLSLQSVQKQNLFRDLTIIKLYLNHV
jgi:hypothetical protein